MKRHQYIITRHNFCNAYDLRWQDLGSRVPEGWVRIARQTAYNRIAEERDRRQYDRDFSGYAPAYIWPYGVETKADCYVTDDMLSQDGVQVVRW